MEAFFLTSPTLPNYQQLPYAPCALYIVRGIGNASHWLLIIWKRLISIGNFHELTEAHNFAPTLCGRKLAYFFNVDSSM